MATFGEESDDDMDEDFNENESCLQLYGLAVLATSFEKRSRKRRCWINHGCSVDLNLDHTGPFSQS